MKKLLSVLLLLFVYQNVQAQEIGQWYTYPSLRTVNDIIVDENNAVWAVTNGGIFKYSNNSFQSFSTLDGLSNQQGTVISYDPAHDLIFAGYTDGSVDVIHTENNSIHTIEAISRAASYTSRRINDMLVQNGRLYVATDFGIVVINTESLLVEESYIQLGDINRASPVLALDISNANIYAGTESGAAVGDLSQELAIQSNWDSYTSTNGFVSTQVLAIASHEGEIRASTDAANYLYDGTSWSIDSTFIGDVIKDYERIGESYLTALSADHLFLSENGSPFVSADLGSETGLKLSPTYDTENLYFGTLYNGFGTYDLSAKEVKYHYPDGPFLNIFTGMLFSEDGTFLSASTSRSARSGIIDASRGYYIYSENEWQNFNIRTNGVLRQANFKLAFTTAETEEYYYIGSWGQGVAKHHKLSHDITVFNENNSIIRGWEDDDPNYPVISGLAVDSRDDVWLVSRYGSNPLYYQQPSENDWIDFAPHPAVSNDLYHKLFIDSNDQKWITLQNSSAAGQGILVLNTGEPLDENDDTAVKLTTGENSGNLPDAQVKAIVEDKNGEIWVGTQRGIARFIFPEFIIEGTANERRAQWLINEDTSAVSRFLLRDANVSTIAVNGANQKWIGTENQGIFVLNEEGSSIIKRFTTENSPLYSDRIVDITIDDASGEVFVSTDMGLISYLDVPQAARLEMKKLKVFPNPFIYASHTQIVIEGLSDQTIIRIVGIDGSVVQQLNARGGRVSWNGLDYAGNKLGSGVYFVIANEEDGKGRGKGKVVIIR